MKKRSFATTAATIALSASFGWIAAHFRLSPVLQADAAPPKAQREARADGGEHG